MLWLWRGDGEASKKPQATGCLLSPNSQECTMEQVLGRSLVLRISVVALPFVFASIALETPPMLGQDTGGERTPVSQWLRQRLTGCRVQPVIAGPVLPGAESRCPSPPASEVMGTGCLQALGERDWGDFLLPELSGLSTWWLGLCHLWGMVSRLASGGKRASQMARPRVRFRGGHTEGRELLPVLC